MRGYISYFKSEILVKLQYRTAAFAGVLTQFFWGFLYVFVYEAFYNYAKVDTINFKELMCYVWLNQAFFSLLLLSIKDNEINDKIKNGMVAYELTRPYDLYLWWYIKIISKRYAMCILRFSPILIAAFLLPKPYNLSLPYSFTSFILFLVALFLGTLLITSICMIMQIIGFFTYQDKGITSLICIIGSLLSGIDIPLPLMPKSLLKITEYLPFRLIGDLSSRLYSGNINTIYGLKSILLQIIWIIVLVFIGKKLMKFALKKVSVQGG